MNAPSSIARPIWTFLVGCALPHVYPGQILPGLLAAPGVSMPGLCDQLLPIAFFTQAPTRARVPTEQVGAADLMFVTARTAASPDGSALMCAAPDHGKNHQAAKLPARKIVSHD